MNSYEYFKIVLFWFYLNLNSLCGYFIAFLFCLCLCTSESIVFVYIITFIGVNIEIEKRFFKYLLDSAHALFVRATYLVCHRLISSWKTDLNVSLAALELLSGLARMHIKDSGN